MRQILVYILAFIPSCLLGTDISLFIGTIGRAQVVLELSKEKGEYRGRYFYVKQGVDIPLNGTLQYLAEPQSYPEPDANEAIGAAWSGTLKHGIFSGTWRSEKGKALPFKLIQLGTYDPNQAGSTKLRKAIQPGEGNGIQRFRNSIDPYRLLKRTEALIPGKSEEHGAVAVQWMKEQRTGISFPRILRHPNPKVMTALNEILTDEHWSLVDGALDAQTSQFEPEMTPWRGSSGGFEEAKVRLTFLSSSFLSITVDLSIYLGGAHPSNEFRVTTLDLLEGDHLDWSKMILPGHELGDDQPAPWKRLLLSKMGPLLNEECREYLEEAPDVFLSEGPAITLVASYAPHVLSLCQTPQATLGPKVFGSLLTPEGRKRLGMQ